MRSAPEIDRLMQSRGFKQTDAYKESIKSKRDLTFESPQDVDVYFVQPDGSKEHVGSADRGAPLSLQTTVGHRFEVQDGFGDVVKVHVVGEGGPLKAGASGAYMTGRATLSSGAPPRHARGAGRSSYV